MAKPKPIKTGTCLFRAASKSANRKFNELAMVVVYFVKGFFEQRAKCRNKKLLAYFADTYVQEDAFVDELVFFVARCEAWRKRQKFDFEDLCDGVYLYEVAEDYLPDMLWQDITAQYRRGAILCLPDDLWIDKVMTHLRGKILEGEMSRILNTRS